MRRNRSKAIALGGVMVALAVVIMCLGGLIPVATYVCPMLCMLLLTVVLRMCGGRIAWAWYGAVTVLCLLLAPDKEAAAVFVLLGYYPIIKPRLDALKLNWVWKLLLFNVCILVLYTAGIWLLGLDGVASEFEELGILGLAVLLILGNITFLLLDKLLVKFVKSK